MMSKEIIGEVMDDPFKEIDFTEIDRLLSVVKGEKPKKRFDGVPTINID